MSLPPLQVRPLGTADLIWLGLFVAAAALYARLAWRGEGRALWILRSALFVLAALLFLQPSMPRRPREARPPVAVVLDASASMAVPAAGPDGPSRWEVVLERLEAERVRLERDFSPAYYVVDRKLRKSSWEEIGRLAPRGAASDFAALAGIPEEMPEAKAVVFFTDGRAGGGKDPSAALARLGIPLHGVGTGPAEAAPDLILEEVRAPRLAFKDTGVEVGVRLLNRGLPPGRVPVQILQGGRVLAAQEVFLSSSSGVTEAVLTFRPAKTGLQTFQAAVPVRGGEAGAQNNSRSFSLRVSRDRIRVLYICGRPGPNYAFLRQQLKSDPAVELVSFVILRDPEDVVNAPDQELSLIPFPGGEALLEQLKSFDVLIFEQFSFASFGLGPPVLAAVRDYVEKGGGLLIMAGPPLLGPGGPYRGTALEDIIPLALDAPPRTGPGRFEAEPADSAHPVTALLDGAADSAAAWRRLPSLEGGGFFPSGAKKGAAVLLSAAGTSDEKPPLLAAWSRGRGRVMAFACLTSWRWALLEAGRGGGPWVYQRFWSNSLRWLSAADDLRLVRLEIPADPVTPGEEVVLRAFVRDENHRPLASADVRAVVEGPGGRKWERVLKSLGNGEYAEGFIPEAPGGYRVAAQAFHRRKSLGRDEAVLQAGAAWEEGRDLGTDFPALEGIARATGGESLALENFSAAWLAKRTAPEALPGAPRAAPWGSPWVFAAMAGLLFTDWILRRLRGMP